MSRTIRKIAIAVAILLLLVLILPFLIPVNSFRPLIESQASAALGRSVQIGDLRLSILRGSLSAENLSIADDPKFSPSPFLTAKSLRVGVELMPLIFSRTLSVTGITIVEPQVTALRGSAGGWNYSSLGGSSSKADSLPAGSQSGGSSFIQGDLSIKHLELENGKIIVGSVGSNRHSTYDNVDVVATDFSMNSRFPVTVSAGLPGGGRLRLEGFAGPMDKGNAALTPVDLKLRITSLNLAAAGFLDPSLGLGGLVGMDSSITSRNGRSTTKGTLTISNALLVAGGSPAAAPVIVDFSTSYDQRGNSGVINPSTVKVGNAIARVKGSYASRGDSTTVDVSLEGSEMPARDVEKFLPAIGVRLPEGAVLTEGTVSADLSMKGPTHRLVTDGTLALSNGKLAGFNLGARMSTIGALAGINTGSDLKVEKLTTNLRIAPDGLRVDNFRALVPELGSLVGAGTVDARSDLDFKMVAKLTPTAAGTRTSSSAGMLSGILSQVTGGRSTAGTTIPFLIKGTTSNPKFVPDVEGLASEILRSEIGASGTATAGSQQQTGNPLGALGDILQKKKKP
jgi:AsmA protein